MEDADWIHIIGARQHNLKNLTVRIPRGKLTVITGPSGAGKSSLAFATLYAEGRRRYMETLSPALRRMLAQLPRPQVDAVENLSPTVAIRQYRGAPNPRSSVGSASEVLHHLRLLFARAGQPHCSRCLRPLQAYTAQEITAFALQHPRPARLLVCAPRFGIARYAASAGAPEVSAAGSAPPAPDGGSAAGPQQPALAEEWAGLAREGFVRVRVDGQVMGLESPPPRQVRSLELVVDRLVLREERGEEEGVLRRRLAEAVELALRKGERCVLLLWLADAAGSTADSSSEEVQVFCEAPRCWGCQVQLQAPEPRHFSFNHPQGACPACQGLGEVLRGEEALAVPNPQLSLAEGAFAPWRGSGEAYARRILEQLAEQLGFSLFTPFASLTPHQRQLLLHGAPADSVRLHWDAALQEASARPQAGAAAAQGENSAEPLSGEELLAAAQASRTAAEGLAAAAAGEGQRGRASHRAEAGLEHGLPHAPEAGLEHGLPHAPEEQPPADETTPAQNEVPLSIREAQSNVPGSDVAATEKNVAATKKGEKFAGLLPSLERRYRETRSERVREQLGRFLRPQPCAACAGDGLSATGRFTRLGGQNIARAAALPLDALHGWLERLPLPAALAQAVAEARERALARLQALIEAGLAHLQLRRPLHTLSAGEARRVQLAAQLHAGLSGVIHVLDEPTAGLHPAEVERLAGLLEQLRAQGNTLVVVEHDLQLLRRADYVLEIGPSAGEEGGQLLHQGSLEALCSKDTPTARALAAESAAAGHGEAPQAADSCSAGLLHTPCPKPAPAPARSPGAGSSSAASAGERIPRGAGAPLPQDGEAGASAGERIPRGAGAPPPQDREAGASAGERSAGNAAGGGIPRAAAGSPRTRPAQRGGAARGRNSTAAAPPAGALLELQGAQAHSLKNISVRIPLGVLVCICGVSGSGKSTLASQVLLPALNCRLRGAPLTGLPLENLRGAEFLRRVSMISQNPLGRSRRATPGGRLGVLGPLRNLFAALPQAKRRGYGPSRFSFNAPGGRCEACQGEGIQRLDMQFLPDAEMPCPVCSGQRFDRQTLEVRYRGKHIAQVLELNFAQAATLFQAIPALHQRLAAAVESGLGYLKLGQPATTLSGGEAMRIKLLTALDARQASGSLFVLDEPTLGLHHQDVALLLASLQRLIAAGASVLVIEHHTGVLRAAAHLIELGPGGGPAGGQVVFQGPPAALLRTALPESATARFLHPAR